MRYRGENLVENSVNEEYREQRLEIALVPCTLQKGLNTLIILGAWTVWKHRNDCVFNGKSPHLSTALSLAGDEIWRWSIAGAKGLSLLAAPGEEI
jgi:hypothetical protein